MLETLLPLYLVGGLLAIGMLIADLYDAFKGDVAEAIGFGDKFKTVSFQLLQTIIFITLALTFSWVTGGFLYMQNKHR